MKKFLKCLLLNTSKLLFTMQACRSLSCQSFPLSLLFKKNYKPKLQERQDN